jgi:hypothetical protein
MAPAVVDLATYREQIGRLRTELAQVDAKRATLMRAIKAGEMVIATALAPEQPLLPIDGLQRSGSRSTTRHGRAIGRKLNKTDRKVLRVIGTSAIAFADLRERSGINEWTLRDSIARLMVAGEVKRFGLARATKFAKAALKTEPDTSLLGFLISQ